MNENVSIKEGNITRKFAPIDKVKVDNTDGTQSIWVPEDDLKTGVLYASDNGIYIASEDGYDAYSEVVIRVEKRIDDNDLIDESGADWKDIDFDGDIGNFDELDNWDVDTLEELSDDLEGFDDLFNDEDKWGEEKEKPITEDEMGDFDGDSISGIDPETGGKVEYSVDEDGFLDEEYIPWTIEITRLPDRTEFYDGHRIVFSGIEVSALTTNADGGDTYTTIPYNELIFPVTIASLDNVSEKKYISDLYPDGVPMGVTSYEAYANPNAKYPSYVFTITGLGFYYRQPGSGNLRLLGASKTEGAELSRVNSYNYITGELIHTFLEDATYSYTHNGKTVWFGVSNWIGQYTRLPEISLNMGEAAWTMIYGEETGGTQTVPVQWISPDGFALEDSYTITVLPDPSGGGDDGGSEGGDTVDKDGRFSWNGRKYKLNDKLAAEVHYANGNVWIEGISTDYNVDHAVDLNLVIPV